MVEIAHHPRVSQRHRILLLDQHPATREGLAAGLEQEREFELCGETGDVACAFPLLAATQPDLVVMEVALRGGSGIDLLRRLRDRYPSIPILVWSRYRESIYAERVIRAGASGFIGKEQPTAAVIDAIRHILKGKVYLSSEMTEVMLRNAGGRSQRFSSDPVQSLSDRELEVFRMIGDCRETQEIAKELHLSLKTVETYRSRIKTKFGADTSSELLRLAVCWELENG